MFIFLYTIPRYLIVHQNGSLDSDLPDASAKIFAADVYEVTVTNENLHLLNYDKEPCNNDKTYDWYQCKHEQIYKVKKVTYFHSVYFVDGSFSLLVIVYCLTEKHGKDWMYHPFWSEHQ